jgi:hypothetical protein
MLNEKFVELQNNMYKKITILYILFPLFLNDFLTFLKTITAPINNPVNIIP